MYVFRKKQKKEKLVNKLRKLQNWRTRRMGNKTVVKNPKSQVIAMTSVCLASGKLMTKQFTKLHFHVTSNIMLEK